MSIQLKLDSYCEDCNRFEAETNKTALYSNSEMTLCETTITCTNRIKCKEIYEYLKAKGEQNDKTIRRIKNKKEC